MKRQGGAMIVTHIEDISDEAAAKMAANVEVEVDLAELTALMEQQLAVLQEILDLLASVRRPPWPRSSIDGRLIAVPDGTDE